MDDTSSVSQSPTTPLYNRFYSTGDFSLGSRNISRASGGSLSCESGAYNGSLQDRIHRIECELLNEKEEHKKLRKVSPFSIFQPNN